jgi:hypothetical protein
MSIIYYLVLFFLCMIILYHVALINLKIDKLCKALKKEEKNSTMKSSFKE